MDKPLNELFGITVSYNELLKCWVAVNNRDQKVIGYGNHPMDALNVYVSETSRREDKPSENPTDE